MVLNINYTWKVPKFISVPHLSCETQTWMTICLLDNSTCCHHTSQTRVQNTTRSHCIISPKYSRSSPLSKIVPPFTKLLRPRKNLKSHSFFFLSPIINPSANPVHSSFKIYFKFYHFSLLLPKVTISVTPSSFSILYVSMTSQEIETTSAILAAII